MTCLTNRPRNNFQLLMNISSTVDENFFRCWWKFSNFWQKFSNCCFVSFLLLNPCFRRLRARADGGCGRSCCRSVACRDACRTQAGCRQLLRREWGVCVAGWKVTALQDFSLRGVVWTPWLYLALAIFCHGRLLGVKRRRHGGWGDTLDLSLNTWNTSLDGLGVLGSLKLCCILSVHV